MRGKEDESRKFGIFSILFPLGSIIDLRSACKPRERVSHLSAQR